MIKIEGYRSESVTLKAEDETCLKCKIAQLREQGFTIRYIDGKVVEGICEHCGLPVYEEQEYVSDNDGLYGHVGCEEGESSVSMERILHFSGPGSGIANDVIDKTRRETIVDGQVPNGSLSEGVELHTTRSTNHVYNNCKVWIGTDPGAAT